MKYLLILIGFFALTACGNQSLECGDLLERYAEKPQKLEFVECKAGTGQTILEATYKVKGEDSKEIEEFLVQKYGIGNLKFVCCGWESTNGENGYVDDKELKMIDPNYTLEVSMYGNAEKENEDGEIAIESDRNKIEFIVTARILDV